MQKEEILSALRQYKRDHADQYGIIDLGVFGSVARGESISSSDIDLCVRTEQPDPFSLVHIKEDIENILNIPVDIIRLRDGMNPHLRARIDKEVLYV